MTKIKRWFPSAVLMAFIFTSSSLPGAVVSSVKSQDALAHKLAHVFLYILLYLSFYRGAKNGVVAFLLTVLYGVSDEFHQLFTFTRKGSVFDVGVDALAAFIAWFVIWKFYQVLPKTLKNWLEE